MVAQGHPPDHNTLYAIAERQSGYFTTQQARSARFTRPLLAHHVHSGLFRHLKHGIYRLTRFPELPHSDLWVAWLEAGPRAVLSHETALALYDLSDLLPGAIHLTVPRTASRRHPGLRLHTSRLDRAEVTHRAGLPVTSVARTITDLIVGHWPEELTRQAIHQALERGLVTRQALSEYAAKRGGRVEQFIRQALVKEAA